MNLKEAAKLLQKINERNKKIEEIAETISPKKCDKCELFEDKFTTFLKIIDEKDEKIEELKVYIYALEQKIKETK